jgi:hypothetical protein
MDFVSEKKILFRLVVLLLVMNTSIIGFLVYVTVYNHPNGNQIEQSKSENVDLIGFLQKELNLSPVQVDSFRIIQREFVNEEARIREIYKPDQDKIINLALQPGDNQDSLDKLTVAVGKGISELEATRYTYYKKLYNACDKQQKDKMIGLFMEIKDVLMPPKQKR